VHVDDGLDGVLSVGGLPDELEAAAGERLRDRAADELLIVDQHDGCGRLQLRAGAVFGLHVHASDPRLLWTLPTSPASDASSRRAMLSG
jgi:hypothetical protein